MKSNREIGNAISAQLLFWTINNGQDNFCHVHRTFGKIGMKYFDYFYYEFQIEKNNHEYDMTVKK